MNESPISLPEKDIQKFAYRRVNLSGVFDKKDVIYVFAGSKGYYLLNPFHLSNGEYILVNLGTVLNKNINLVNTNPINIYGVLYCESNRKINWVARNDIKNNIWFWFDIIAMSKFLNISLKPCVIWADKVFINNESITSNTPLKPFNRHFEYIITWYTLAVVWAIGWCICLYKSKKNK